MNGEANVALENWEKLFKKLEDTYIDKEAKRIGIALDVELTDSEDDLYDFGNEILMESMQLRLVWILEDVTSMTPTDNLKFGNKFFMTMNEQQQENFFFDIFMLPVSSINVGEATDNRTESPATTMSTSALLETLPHLHEDVSHLTVNNFALTHQSDVQELANIILAKCETLEFLRLENIECPVDDCNKQDSDESDGF